MTVEILKKNSEVRIQKSEFRSQNQDALYETLKANEYSLSASLSVEDSDSRLIAQPLRVRERLEDHQIFLFCGGAKTPIIQTLDDSLTLRYPPVIQNSF